VLNLLFRLDSERTCVGEVELSDVAPRPLGAAILKLPMSGWKLGAENRP
jgi:hypothetical protein